MSDILGNFGDEVDRIPGAPVEAVVKHANVAVGVTDFFAKVSAGYFPCSDILNVETVAPIHRSYRVSDIDRLFRDRDRASVLADELSFNGENLPAQVAGAVVLPTKFVDVADCSRWYPLKWGVCRGAPWTPEWWRIQRAL